MALTLTYGATRLLNSGPFTALFREAVVGPALMPGGWVEIGAGDEPRLRDFSLPRLEPGAVRRWLKPC